MSLTDFQLYAQEYDTTVAEAIADRDWPMDEVACCKAFHEAEARQPTMDEVATMRPDSAAAVNECRQTLNQEMADWR